MMGSATTASQDLDSTLNEAELSACTMSSENSLAADMLSEEDDNAVIEGPPTTASSYLNHSLNEAEINACTMSSENSFGVDMQSEENDDVVTEGSVTTVSQDLDHTLNEAEINVCPMSPEKSLTEDMKSEDYNVLNENCAGSATVSQDLDSLNETLNEELNVCTSENPIIVDKQSVSDNVVVNEGETTASQDVDGTLNEADPKVGTMSSSENSVAADVPSDEDADVMTDGNDGRVLVDIDSMRKIIENRKLKKEFRVPIVPAYLHDGLDEDDELLMAFRSRQDESMTCMCILCYKWYEDKPALASHMIAEHRNNTRLEKCSHCSKTFFARFLRLRHEKIHKYDMKYPHTLYYPSVEEPYDCYVPNHFYKRFKVAPFTKDYSRLIKGICKEVVNTPYECCDCGKVFKDEEPLREHYERHHAVQLCCICKESFLDVETLRKHEWDVHEHRPVDKNYQGGAWRLWKHWEKQRQKEIKAALTNIEFMHTYAYKEEDCEEIVMEPHKIIEKTIERQLDVKMPFKRPSTLAQENVIVKRMKPNGDDNKLALAPLNGTQAHRQSQVAQKPVALDEIQILATPPSIVYKCEMCNQQFPTSEEMLCHVQKSHADDENSRPYKCQFCGRGFATHSNRKEHERIHTGEKPYVCPYCSRGFVQISNLKKHMQTHKEKNNLQCKTCGKQFVKESSLILHQRAHAVDRKFKCAHCDKAYNYSSLLKRHERIHTGEMPYQCDVCLMPFHELVSLTYHRKKVHTGERPHKCDTCERAFILSSDLKKHLKVHFKTSVKDEGDGSDVSDVDSTDSLLRKEIMEDAKANAQDQFKEKTFLTYSAGRATNHITMKNDPKLIGMKANAIKAISGGKSKNLGNNPPVEIYEVYDDENEESDIGVRSKQESTQKRKNCFPKDQKDDRDTTVVWMENSDEAESKFIVLDHDGNEIDGDSIELCEIYDDEGQALPLNS